MFDEVHESNLAVEESLVLDPDGRIVAGDLPAEQGDTQIIELIEGELNLIAPVA